MLDCNRASILSHFRDNGPQTYGGHDHDLSRSRDVIGHETNRSAICHFLLVSHWNRISIFNPCSVLHWTDNNFSWHVVTQMDKQMDRMTAYSDVGLLNEISVLQQQQPSFHRQRIYRNIRRLRSSQRWVSERDRVERRKWRGIREAWSKACKDVEPFHRQLPVDPVANTLSAARRHHCSHQFPWQLHSYRQQQVLKPSVRLSSHILSVAHVITS